METICNENMDGVFLPASTKGHEAVSGQADFEGSRLVDASCQTDFVVIDVGLAELKQRMASGVSNNVKEALTAGSIKAIAQSVVKKAGWVYDPGTRTYFDYSTNLYYYPETRLYYNYKNGCYYRYNQESRNYEFHYQLDSFKGHSQTINLQSRHIKTSPKRIEVKRHSLPNLKSVEIEWRDEALMGTKNDRMMTDAEFPYETEDYPWGGKIRKLSESLKCEDTVRCDRDKFKGYYSDSESYRSRKKYKYYRCNVCHGIILPTCCKKNKPIKERVVGRDFRKARASDSETARMTYLTTRYTKCLDCYGLASSTCCLKQYFWCDPIHARPKKRSRTGKRQKKKRLRRPRYISSSSSLTETETQSKESIELHSIEATVAGTKVEYTADVHSNVWTNADTDTSMIPCIRAMVTSSQSIDVGTLFVITCNGAFIGSNDDCEIQIDEEDVAGKHASIGYNLQQRNYFITDLGSATGTTLNSTSENNPGVKTVLPVPVTHKSVLLIGSCIFVLHLHHGYDTCDDCEPGQVKALLQNEQLANSQRTGPNQDREMLRLSELKNLKKKYNLHKGERIMLGRQYTDRAEQRRKTVGSDNPYEKDEMPTSYDKEIADHNKGHQMLKKMGWNKGASLGKSQVGITEPITPRGTATGKHGLGYGGS